MKGLDYEAIARAVGFDSGELRRFKVLCGQFREDMLANPLPAFYDLEMVLPMLIYLIKDCEIVGSIKQVAVELASFLSVHHPAERPLPTPESVGMRDYADVYRHQMLTSFCSFYGDLVRTTADA